MILRILAATAFACATAVSLSGCSTLGSLPAPSGAAANASHLVDTLTAFNNALAQNCSGNFNVTWAPPLPPAGAANLNCQVKPPIMAMPPQAGSPTAAPARATEPTASR